VLLFRNGTYATYAELEAHATAHNMVAAGADPATGEVAAPGEALQRMWQRLVDTGFVAAGTPGPDGAPSFRSVDPNETYDDPTLTGGVWTGGNGTEEPAYASRPRNMTGEWVPDSRGEVWYNVRGGNNGTHAGGGTNGTRVHFFHHGGLTLFSRDGVNYTLCPVWDPVAGEFAVPRVRLVGRNGEGQRGVRVRAEAAFTATFADLSMDTWTDEEQQAFRTQFKEDLARNFAAYEITADDVEIKEIRAGSVMVDAAVVVPDLGVAEMVADVLQTAEDTTGMFTDEFKATYGAPTMDNVQATEVEVEDEAEFNPVTDPITPQPVVPTIGQDPQEAVTPSTSDLTGGTGDDLQNDADNDGVVVDQDPQDGGDAAEGNQTGNVFDPPLLSTGSGARSTLVDLHAFLLAAGLFFFWL